MPSTLSNLLQFLHKCVHLLCICSYVCQLLKTPLRAILEGHTLNVALHDNDVSAAHSGDQNQQPNGVIWGDSPDIVLFDKKFDVWTDVVAVKPNDEVLDSSCQGPIRTSCCWSDQALTWPISRRMSSVSSVIVFSVRGAMTWSSPSSIRGRGSFTCTVGTTVTVLSSTVKTQQNSVVASFYRSLTLPP